MGSELKNNNPAIQPPTQAIAGSMTPEQVEVMVSQMYMGPIPPASEFAKYEKALPGSADRILKMAEKQSSHRQAMEDKMLEENIKTSRRGQAFGFILALVVVAVGVCLLMSGKDLLGFATIIAELVGLVGLFVYNRESEKKELSSKKKEK